MRNKKNDSMSLLKQKGLLEEYLANPTKFVDATYPSISNSSEEKTNQPILEVYYLSPD